MLTKSKFLTNDEFEHLHHRLTSIHTRDSLLLLVALETGARSIEVLNIRAADLDDEDMSVLIKAKKLGQSREFPLQPTTYRKLKYLCYISGGHPFPITTRRFRQIWHEWRPCKKKLHALRHTKAIRAYRKTKDIKLVQQVLGHKSIQSTMVYVDYLYTAGELRKLGA